MVRPTDKINKIGPKENFPFFAQGVSNQKIDKFYHVEQRKPDDSLLIHFILRKQRWPFYRSYKITLKKPYLFTFVIEKYQQRLFAFLMEIKVDELHATYSATILPRPIPSIEKIIRSI
jgi:hypothetical protein